MESASKCSNRFDFDPLFVLAIDEADGAEFHSVVVAQAAEGTIEEPLVFAGLGAVADGDIGGNDFHPLGDGELTPGALQSRSLCLEVDPEWAADCAAIDF